MNKKVKHCKYSDSCFTCPKDDCVINAHDICNVNKTEYDIYERDHLKEVKRKGNYKSVESKYRQSNGRLCVY